MELIRPGWVSQGQAADSPGLQSRRRHRLSDAGNLPDDAAAVEDAPSAQQGSSSSNPPAERSRLHFSLPLSAETWVARIIRACAIIEGDPALPREPLAYTFNRDRMQLLENRTAYLWGLLADPYRYLVLTNGRTVKFDGSSAIDSGHVGINGVVNDTAGQAYDLTVEFPAMPWEVRESLLAAIGDALGAYTGHITPARAAQAFASHYLLDTASADNSSAARAGWERDARPLRDCMERLSIVVPRIHHISVGGGRADPLQPATLGWINCWSADVCDYLGFPRAERDEDLLELAYQTPQGSWIVKVCEEPLDVSVPSHIERIASVYERFPRLGIRVDAPAATPAIEAPMTEIAVTEDLFEILIAEDEITEIPVDDDPTITTAEAEPLPPAPEPASDTHAYLATSNQEAVAEAVSRALASIAGVKVSMQMQDAAQVLHATHFDPAKPQWSVTIAPGTKGWTVIDAQPKELLAHRGSNGVPLIAQICQRARARGFLFAARGPAEAILMEADAWGDYLLSGGVLDESAAASATFHGNPLSPDRIEVRFEIVPIQIDLLEIDDYQQLADYFKTEIGRK